MIGFTEIKLTLTNREIELLRKLAAKPLFEEYDLSNKNHREIKALEISCTSLQLKIANAILDATKNK